MATKRNILLRLMADDSDAERGLKATERRVKAFDKIKAEARADIKTAGLDAKLEKLQARLHRLGQQVSTPDVKIKTAGVLGQIERVEAELRRLDGKNIDVNVRAHDRTGGRLAGLTGGAEGGLAARAGGAAAGAGLGAGAIALLAKRSIDTASDVNEALSKNKQLFGEAADDIDRFSRRSTNALGISRKAALDATGVFGAMLATLKLGHPEAAKMSERLTTLAGDLASFHNVDPAQALEDLRSGLSGETEPLRKYGILLSDARLRQEALRQGLVKTTKEALTPQQKALAAYSLSIKDAGKANGDAGRTINQLAGQTRVLKANIDDLFASVGQRLLPVTRDAITVLNAFFGELLHGQVIGRAVRIAVAGVIERFGGMVDGIKSTVRLIKAIFHGDLREAFRSMRDIAIGGIQFMTQGIAGHVLDLVRTAGRKVGNALVGGIKSAFRGVVQFVQHQISDLISVYNAIPVVPNISDPFAPSVGKVGPATRDPLNPGTLGRLPRPHAPAHAPSGRTFGAGFGVASVVQNFGDVILPASAALTGNEQYDALKLHRHLRRRGTSLPA